MRILYIHQYFASRRGKTGTRSYEFGRYLAGRGHEVTMLTSGLANAEFPVCRNQPCCEYRLDGMRVIAIAAEKVTVIPNGSDLDLFRPGLDGRTVRDRLGLGRRFAAIYFGAMGLANGLEYVIEAARVLAERGANQIVLVLLGSGGRRDELESLARTYGLSNVVFHAAADKEKAARLVAGCDVCLTIYRAAKEHTWSPNKLFDALAAGKLVLLNVAGWLRETVEQNHCGRYVDPCRPEALAEALEALSNDPALCRQMGENARALAERQFDRRILAAQLEQVLQNAVDGPAPRE